jgi:tryptophan halogenase
MNKIKSITVLGGGTAGLISALLLKKNFPHIDIQLIKSEKIGTIGVGEGTTEHWRIFTDLVEIDMLEYMKECEATIKIGVSFEQWTKKPYIHSIFGGYDLTHNGYYSIYGHLISNDYDPLYLCPRFFYDNLIFENNLKNHNFFSNQYHFDAGKLNKFLEKNAKKYGIKIITDDIIDAELDESGNINCLISNDNSYFSDFFIDCSGFQRFLLHKKLNVRWKSYSKYLPLNSAFAFLTEEMEDYSILTKITSHSSGWSWSIPTQSRTGNGYVFCDEFISFDDAKTEMEQFHNRNLDIKKVFKFEPGKLEKFWYKNCVAVGISAGFVEPLEATSISFSIQQIRCLCTLIASGDSETYNYHMNSTFNNIFDFIQAHYITKREDTSFWKEVKNNLNVTNSLSENLIKWKNRLPHSSDIDCAWPVFHPINYIQMLYAQEWFDIEKIKKEYEFYGQNELIKDMVNKLLTNNELQNKIGHRDFIKKITNKNSFIYT